MLFMRGRIFMNQIMLDVKLFASGKDDDILSFDFENNECRVNLNSDSCQSELKKVFSELVMLLLHNDITLNLKIEKGYNRGLYKDVCSEYIKDLQRELEEVKDKIRSELLD